MDSLAGAEAGRLEIEKRRVEIEERRFVLERRRAAFERERLRIERRFLNRHFAAIITAIVSISAGFFSIVQLARQDRQKVEEVRSQERQKRYEFSLAAIKLF
jgi:hypothetical protein